MTKMQWYTKPFRLLLVVALVISVGATALTWHTALSAEWPNCGWKCIAGDVQLHEVWLASDASGTRLGPCANGTSVTAYIVGNFTNGTGTDRYAVWLLFDLYINGNTTYTEQCDLDVLPAGSQLAPIWGPFSWTCGQEVKIQNLIVNWLASSST